MKCLAIARHLANLFLSSVATRVLSALISMLEIRKKCMESSLEGKEAEGEQSSNFWHEAVQLKRLDEKMLLVNEP